MSETGGLVAAFRLDGRGGGTALDWAGIRAWTPAGGPLWVHLDYTHPEAVRWLRESSGLDESVALALLAEETRPRSVVTHGGLLVVLRGVNLNPGSELEDMVSIRLFLEEHRAISTRHRRVMAIDALRAALAAGHGPRTSAELLVDIADGLTTRIGSVLAELDDQVDALDDEVLTRESYALRSAIGSMRRKVIALRRYLAPQRDAVAHLQGERLAWLDEVSRIQLREIADRTTRFVEDLDEARDRAAVTQEELNSRLSERMNRTLYMLSIVTGIFLPLGLLTGLLGINVGGMPGAGRSDAFLIVCGLLAAMVVVQLVLFKRMKWL